MNLIECYLLLNYSVLQIENKSVSFVKRETIMKIHSAVCASPARRMLLVLKSTLHHQRIKNSVVDSPGEALSGSM